MTFIGTGLIPTLTHVEHALPIRTPQSIPCLFVTVKGRTCALQSVMQLDQNQIPMR